MKRAPEMYMRLTELDPDQLKFNLSTDKRLNITMFQGANASDVAFVSPACVTQWPRCTGDGNFGTMWGPTDVSKAKYTLDLCDTSINGQTNTEFAAMAQKLEQVDDKLLDFVYQNQLRILGRKNLTKEECKMLQIRSVRAKYDKNSGMLTGHSVQLNTPKYSWDGMGGKYARTVNICDHAGAVLPTATVAPGDVVCATVYCAQVYNGVGGDKFGIQWSFNDVQVVCQRAKLEVKKTVTAFGSKEYEFAQTYDDMSVVEVSS